MSALTGPQETLYLVVRIALLQIAGHEARAERDPKILAGRADRASPQGQAEQDGPLATCQHCKAEMQTDGVNSWCVQAGCSSDHFDDFDDDDGDDVAGDDEWELECGLASDGQCSQAGTEHCDWSCPYSSSELFAGSAAWREKHKPKKSKAPAE